MEFSGRLSAFPPANILQWASHERRTGALIIRNSRIEKRVFFRDGSVVGCVSSDPAEHYGQYLLLHGYIEEPAFVEALRHCKQTGRRLGTSLVDLGMLDEEQVRESLHRRLVDAVCDLFLWIQGVFFFRTEVPPHELISPHPVDTMAVVMEGTRWVDELARIRRVFIHDYVVLRRGPRWPAEGARPLERRICAAVDNARGLRELHGSVRGSWYRFLETAFALCLSEVLDVATLVEVQERESKEVPLLDLMLEQAADEEKAIFDGRRRAVPLETVLSLCPLWTPNRPPVSEDDTGTSLEGFRSRLDGRTPLAEALSENRKIREKELELFQVALARGELALLPLPSPEAEARDGAHWWRNLLGAEKGG